MLLLCIWKILGFILDQDCRPSWLKFLLALLSLVSLPPKLMLLQFFKTGRTPLPTTSICLSLCYLYTWESVAKETKEQEQTIQYFSSLDTLGF
jgi:hypothetical protein